MTPTQRCERYETEQWDAADARAVSALDAHADGCRDCGAARERRASYDAVVGRARAAASAAEDLTPQAWVQIREGVEAATARPARWAFAWPAALAGAAALALAMVWFAPSTDDPHTDRATTAASVTPAASSPAASPSAPRSPAADLAKAQSPDATEDILAPGALVEATDDARTLVAFGRHVLTLAPASAFEVISWTPDAMILDVRRGSLECDVARATAEELFEVRSGHARVRVLGTRFTVSVEGDGATGIRVAHGLVEVTHPAGTSRLAAGQWDRFGGRLTTDTKAGAGSAGSPASAYTPRAARPSDHAGRVSDPTKLIDIKVPDQRMDKPGAGLSGPPARPAAARREDLKLIEIVVPPQGAPGE
ncbi:MAG: FecR domain-containing protein [Myxococcota bacterium]